MTMTLLTSQNAMLRSQCRSVPVTCQSSGSRVAREHVRCAAPRLESLSRRAAFLSLTSLPFLSGSARALLPAEDEDDEELVGLAKSRRKERMAEERRVQESFVNKADYTGADVVRVQNAVNKLAKGGLSLEAGDLSPLANASDSWVVDFKKAVGDLSSSPAAQKSSTEVLSSLDALSKTFQGGDVQKAKSTFVATVSALQTWIVDAGLSNQIKGL